MIKFRFGLGLEWRGIFTSGNFGLKQAVLAMVSSPKLLLDAVRNPAGVRPAWVIKFRFGSSLERRGIFTSGNFGLKNAVLPMVSSPAFSLMPSGTQRESGPLE